MKTIKLLHINYQDADNMPNYLTGIALQMKNNWLNGVVHNKETAEVYFVYGTYNEKLNIELVPLKYAVDLDQEYQEFNLADDSLIKHVIANQKTSDESFMCKYTVRDGETVMSYTEEDVCALEETLNSLQDNLLPEAKKRYRFWNRNIQKLELRHFS